MRFSATVFLFRKKYAPASDTWVLGVGASVSELFFFMSVAIDIEAEC